MKLSFFSFLLLGFVHIASATAQFPDNLLFGGKLYALHSNPLEQYFEKYPDRRPRTEITSSALWRGYKATFEIVESQLYVKEINIQFSDSSAEMGETKWKNVISDVFPGQEKVKVDWLTGLLVVPHGKLINYVHMGYGSTYNNYILLEVERGSVTKVKKFKHKAYAAFKDKQFEAFKKTAEYAKFKETSIKNGLSDEQADNFLRNFVIEYTSRILVDCRNLLVFFPRKTFFFTLAALDNKRYL